MKLARKLTLALVAGVLAVLAAQAYFRVARESAFFERDIAHDNDLIGRAVAAATARVWAVGGAAAGLSLVDEANEREAQVQIKFVWLDAPAGDPRAPLLPRAALEPVRRGGEIVQKGPGPDGTPHLVTYVPVAIPGEAPAAIELAESLAGRAAYLRTTAENTLVGTGAVLLVCGAIASAVGLAFVGRPVNRLVAQARRVGAGDLSQRVEGAPRDELGELSAEMNLMCDRLAAANERAAREAAARERTLAELRHADRLATLGKLASGVAHELGTPLLVVIGRGAQIADGEATGDEVAACGRAVVEHARKMERIVRQLLDFARQRTSAKAEVDLRELVREAFALAAPLAAKRRAKLVLEGPDAGRVLATVDPDHVRQAVTNLVVNGVQAMPSGGTLTVRLAREAAPSSGRGGARAGEHVVIEVKDEGEGMAEETRAHIFEPFFTTKPVGEGTGLGLSVAYGIVEEHGGFFEVESEPGRGSTFRVHLPVREEAPS
jgi:signal transduction histidine kinase